MPAVMNIHFFRKSTLEKIDYTKVLDYFESLPNFEVFYTDNYVEIAFKDTKFALNYRYLITKKSKVSNIYKLNPMYSNVNFLLEMPIMIPSFLAKEIITIAQKLCHIFELGVYHDSFDDVRAFNVVEFLDFFEKQRAHYIQENGLDDKITYDNEKLNVICKFQKSVESLISYYHDEVIVNLCYPIRDNETHETGICYDWKFSKPVIFPPYVDYINIIDDETGHMLVRRDELFQLLSKYLVEIQNYLPDMYILKGKQAKSCRREMKKIRKIVMDKNYKILGMCDVIEE